MMYTNKQLLQLTLPLFAEQFLIVFVGVADTFMVSYAGEAAVSGVALVDTISFLITAVLGALCTGGAVVASQYLGSGDRQKVALTGRLLLGGALLIGLVILAGVELLGAPALRLIFGNVEADVMQSARGLFRGPFSGRSCRQVCVKPWRGAGRYCKNPVPAKLVRTALTI